jgi:glycosyltransferase involved in cell wall biosynthesis
MTAGAPSRRPGISPAAPARPTRVLYLINGFSRGGAEDGLVRLVRGGAFAGVELTIASLIKGSGEPLAALAALGADVRVLRPSARMRPSDVLFGFLGLYVLVRRLRPDVILLSLPQANILGRIAAMLTGTPIVASFEHNTRLAKPIYELAYRLTSRRVDWLLADCETTAQEAGRRLYTRAPADQVILPLIAFDEAENGVADPAVAGGPLRIGNAGRLTTVKNQQALIRAVRLLADEGVDVDLRLFGEGDEFAACDALIESLGLRDRVRLMGYVEAWWAAGPLDAFVLSSRHEGLCIAALEAMHHGVPVVAPAIGGLRDYGSPNNFLALSDVEPETIARAIKLLAQSPERRARLAAEGKATVKRRFGAAAAAAAYAAFSHRLRSVCEGS